MLIHTVNSLSIDRGGPSRTVTSLVGALAQYSHAIQLITTQDSRASQERCLPSTRAVKLVIAPDGGVLGSLAIQFYRQLAAVNRAATISGIHDHGLWKPTSFWAAHIARRARIPLFLSPRGMLDPFSLAQKRAKKTLAMVAYQRRILEQVAVYFATSEEEAKSIRKIGLRQPIAVIPNGVALPEQHRAPGNGKPERARTVLFLSRIHKQKGLLNLVQAWSGIVRSGWNLVIAGNDDGGHEAVVRRTVEQLGVGDSVIFAGPAEGLKKEALYLAADLFVLPSFSENFGVVVAEALAYGVPAISTTGSPWRELRDVECGWWVAPEARAIAAALSDAMHRTDAERYEMGLRGRHLVAGKYSWPSAARSTMAVYDWALGKGRRPDFVV